MDSKYLRHSGLLDQKYKDFFVPTILTSMSTTMSIVVDSIIVGNFLGAASLAAVNLVMPIMMGYMTLAMLLGMGAATAISVAKGQHQDQFANDVFTTSLMVMLLFSVGLISLQTFYLNDLSHLLSKDPVLYPLVKSYLQILIYCTPLFVVTTGMVFCLRTDGKVKLASTILIVANVANLIFDLVYMGYFKMGISGSSLATVSGYAVGAGVLSTYIFAKDRTLCFNFKLLKKPFSVIANTQKILKVGCPAAMSSVLMMLKILSLNTIILTVAGRSGMVAFSVCISCLSLVSMFISGAAQSMMPIVGTLFGEKDYTGIRFVVKRALQVLLITTAVAVIVLEVSPGFILTVFGVTDAADHIVGIPAVRIFAVSLVGTSISYLALYYYMTIGKRRIANAISVVQGFAIVVPAAFVLSKFFGINGVWIAFIIAEVVTLLMVWGYCFYMKKQAPQKYKDPLLLDMEMVVSNNVLELTVENRMDYFEDLFDNICVFLKHHGATLALCQKIEVSLREMMTNITKHGYSKNSKAFIDLRITIEGDSACMVIRDGGRFFDPCKYLENLALQNASTPQGLVLVSSTTEHMEYSRVIGLNTTTMRL